MEDFHQMVDSMDSGYNDINCGKIDNNYMGIVEDDNCSENLEKNAKLLYDKQINTCDGGVYTWIFCEIEGKKHFVFTRTLTSREIGSKHAAIVQKVCKSINKKELKIYLAGEMLKTRKIKLNFLSGTYMAFVCAPKSKEELDKLFELLLEEMKKFTQMDIEFYGGLETFLYDDYYTKKGIKEMKKAGCEVYKFKHKKDCEEYTKYRKDLAYAIMINGAIENMKQPYIKRNMLAYFHGKWKELPKEPDIKLVKY